MGIIAEALIELGIEVKGAEQAEKSVEGVKDSAEDLKTKGGGSIEKFAEGGDLSMKSLVKSFAGSKAALLLGTAAIAAAVVAATKQVVDFVNETTAALDETSKAAQASAMPVEEFQRMSVVAQHTGTSIDDISKATRRVNVSLLDIANGGGADFLANLNKIGLAAEDLQGLDQTAQLGVISDALNQVSSDSERAALASKIFGEEAGPNLANLIAEGSAGINKMSKDVGKVFTEEQIGQAVAYQDSLTDLKQSVSVLKGEIALALVPTIQDVVGDMREWINENREGLTAIVKVINVGIKPLLLNLKLLLIPIKLVVEASLSFYEAIVDVAEALKELGQQALETAGEWGWVQDIAAAFAVVGEIVDSAKQKVVEFISQFEPLRRLAIKLGIIEADEGGSGLGGLRDRVVGAVTGGTDAVEGAALRQQNEEQQEARQRQEAKQRAGQVTNEYGSITRQLTDAERADIYQKVGDPQIAEEAIQSINWRASGNKQAKPTRGGKVPKEKETAEIRQLTSFEELLMSTLGPGFTLEGIPIKELPMADKDIKPEAIVNIFNVSNEVTQHIEGVNDPLALAEMAGKAVATEIRKVLVDAGQNAQVNFAR